MSLLRRLLFPVFFLTSACYGQSGTDSNVNVILIGWDGAQRNHVKEALKSGELPHLAAIISEGALVDIDITETTDTKAGWAQILTGYKAQLTGVYSNGNYGPIPGGYTVFERLEEHFGKSKIVTGAIIGKKGNIDSDGPRRVPVNRAKGPRVRKLRAQSELVSENGISYYLVPAKPYYHTRDALDVFTNGLKLDDTVGTRALEFLQENKGKRFFLFVHFAQVDHSGHLHGENSKEYGDALISADRWTGEISKKLRELGIDKKTFLYVTADHGFDEGQRSHHNAPSVVLATNDPAVRRNGNRADIAPTILSQFGIAPEKFQPPLNGFPLTER